MTELVWTISWHLHPPQLSSFFFDTFSWLISGSSEGKPPRFFPTVNRGVLCIDPHSAYGGETSSGRHNAPPSWPEYKSHHTSTFWSGIAIGSAVVALGLGIAHSFEQKTRDAIPGWDGLLLSMRFGRPAVLCATRRLEFARVGSYTNNYVFIFELNPRTSLDHREYFQTPSILFATLCYAFWLTFARIGAQL
ncbi:hypothetical protein B0H12DRAFT_622 [Mycena haematopus]|nr:hypothetical protein B0H12DRAFT_622 [Mycena haematopus]